MNKQESVFTQNKPTQDSPGLVEVFSPFIRKWYLYVIAILVLVFGVKIYLRYSIPIYESKATVLIKQDEKNKSSQGINVIENLEMLQTSSNLMNEIEVMKAHSVLGPLIDSLNLRLTSYLIGDNSGFRKMDLYEESPIEISVAVRPRNQNLNTDKFAFSTKLKILSKSQFSIDESQNTYTFGDKITVIDPDYVVRFKLKPEFQSKWIGKTIELNYVTKEKAIYSVAGKIDIDKKNKEATVLTIVTQGPNRKRNNDILTVLIESYRNDALNDKNRVAANTSAFIKDRMKFLLKELDDVEKSGETFKVKNKIVNFDSDITENLTGKSEADHLSTEAEIELNLVEFLTDYLNKNDDFSVLLPANLGFKDGDINGMTNQYNKLVLDRSKLLQTTNSSNPLIRKTESQLTALKESLEKGLRNLKNSVSVRMNSYKKKYSFYDAELSEMPGFEREYRSILRQQQIKESLYLYLLQKREENEIELAASVSNIKVIQPSHDTGEQISPKSNNLYLIALVIALAIPTGLIYVVQLLNNKVKNIQDLEGFNVIGQIPESEKNISIIAPNDRTYLSEAFRMLRANISFFLQESERKSHLIAISSTLPNEGKTFTSVNLANSLSNIGHKVVIVGLDLRVPKLSEYFTIKDNRGVSNFIVDTSLSVNDIIQKDTENENLFFINAGDIPPNPSELLMRDRFNELIENLRQNFKYVILDTSPIGIIADCLPVVQKADLLIYIVRCNFLDKKLLRIPKDYVNDGLLSNFAVVLNYIDPIEKRYGYGYKYNYHYGSSNGYFSKISKGNFLTRWFFKKKS